MPYDYELIVVEVSDAVATMTLNRPPMNPMSPQLFLEIGQCARELSLDQEVRAVVITGGEKVFSAGADITELIKNGPIEVAQSVGIVQASFSAVEDIPKPTIAAINGFAVGGGCELSICCDFRYAHEGAMIGQPEMLLGVIHGAGGCNRLPRLVGPAWAKEIIYSGRIYTAQQCLDMGLIQRIVSGDDSVIEVARKTAARYAKGPAVALAMAKRVINKGMECSIEEGLIIEAQGIALCFASEDQKIGMRSFLEEGPGKARFIGR